MKRGKTRPDDFLKKHRRLIRFCLVLVRLFLPAGRVGGGSDGGVHFTCRVTPRRVFVAPRALDSAQHGNQREQHDPRGFEKGHNATVRVSMQEPER